LADSIMLSSKDSSPG